MEVAAALASKCKSVTACDMIQIPFSLILGPAVGKALQKLHEDKGVKFIFGNSAKEFVGKSGAVKEVILQDGTKIPADVVIMGVGVQPTTDFLKSSNITMNERGFVTVDKRMKSSLEDVYVGGDIVEFPLFLANDALCNIQHWQMAHQHGRIAALNMMDKAEDIRSVPFFWTQMFGKSLRYCGFGFGYEDVVIHGSPDEFTFVAYYIKDNIVVAGASMGMDPLIAQLAELMLSGEQLTRDEIKDDPKAWLGRLLE